MSRDYVKNQRSSRSAPQSSSTGPSGMVWLFVGILMGLIIAGIFYVKNQHSIPAEEMPKPNVAPSSQPAKSQQSSNATTSNQNLQTQFDFYNVLPSQKIVGPSGDEDTSDINSENNSLNNPPPAATATQQNATQQNAMQQNQAQQNTDQTNNQTPNTTPSTNVTPTPSANTSTTPPSSTTPNTDKSTNQNESATATSSSTSNKTSHATAAASNNTDTNATPTAATPKDDNYILQIATFSQFTAADQLKAQLSLAGFEVNISQIQHDGKAMERVWVGPFHTQSEAATVQKQLQDNQISSKLLKSS